MIIDSWQLTTKFLKGGFKPQLKNIPPIEAGELNPVCWLKAARSVCLAMYGRGTHLCIPLPFLRECVTILWESGRLSAIETQVVIGCKFNIFATNAPTAIRRLKSADVPFCCEHNLRSCGLTLARRSIGNILKTALKPRIDLQSEYSIAIEISLFHTTFHNRLWQLPILASSATILAPETF